MDEIKSQLQIKSKPIIKVPIDLKMMERFQLDIMKCRKCESGRYQLMEILHAGQASDGVNENGLCDIKIFANKAPPQSIESMKHSPYKSISI